MEGREPEFRLGEGKISGAVAAGLGALGFGAVLCLLFPSLLTTPDMRAVYPMDFVRALIQLVLALAFGLGVLSVVLSRRRGLGFAGIFLSMTATLLGGSKVEVETPIVATGYIGLDWFILNLFFLALVFVPMERVFGRLRDQKIFRRGWKTDVAHFFASHVLVQATVLLTMIPAALFFRWIVDAEFQTAVSTQPVPLQAVEALILADLFAYGSHRLFHSVPMLWRFHQIHHSSEMLDWLASSRLHLVDIVITRAVAFIPLYVMGFSTSALYPYLIFASLQGIFIHSNLRLRFGPLRFLLVTPQFHHWHHTAQREALDRNFAIHRPLIDWIFGTYYLPREVWPEVYGIEGDPVPSGYVNQLVYPFARGSREP